VTGQISSHGMQCMHRLPVAACTAAALPLEQVCRQVSEELLARGQVT